MRDAVTAVALVGLLGSAGCGGDTAEPDPPSTTTTTVGTQPPATTAPTTTTSTTAAPTGDEAEVRAVIDRYWDAFIEATAIPDPTNTALNEILVGEAQIRIVGAIEVMQRDGQRVVPPTDSVFAHEVTSVTFERPDLATVKECVIDDLQIVDAQTGAVINGAVTTSEYTSVVRNDDTGWHITKSDQTKRLEGVHECSALDAAPAL